MDSTDVPLLSESVDFNAIDGNDVLFDFDELLYNNFNSDLHIEQELEKNNEEFEKLIFGEHEEKNYNVLDPVKAHKIIEANKTEELNSFLVQCQNCDDLFTKECFECHVCEYDENKQLIPSGVVQQHSVENEFQILQKSTLKMLAENQSQIRKLIKVLQPQPPPQPKDDKAKQSNHECFVCTRKFVHESGLYRHYDKHIGEIMKSSVYRSTRLYSIILCAFCGECFSIEKDVWVHLRKTHLEVNEEETYIKFSSNEFQMSVTEVDSSKRVIENIKASVRNFPIEEFVRSIFVKNLYHCEFCSSAFANSKSLLLHVSKHEPASHFQCEYCQLKGFSLKNILLHRYEECVYYRDYRNKIKDIPCIWMCNVCDAEFYGVEHLILHRHSAFHFFPRLDNKSNQIFFSCELCTNCFETATLLVSHLLDKHLKKPRTSTFPETSTRVPKSPTSVRKGGIHQTSTRARQYLCEICGKSYTQSSHLWQHLRFHQGIKPFECPHEPCGRKFTIRPDLNDHIRKCHTGERPYECTICGKRFLTGSVFYQHRLIHRGERRYGCEKCGKRFYRADALKNHQLIHTGLKPYKCWVKDCDKSFRQRGDRDKHVKARHKDAPPMPSPPKKRMKVQSFGRGRTKNNMSLYSAKPASLDIISF